MKNIFFRKITPILVITAVLVTANLAFFQIATAATLTSSSDTMTNLNTSALSSHDILFTVPTTTGGGFPLSGTITLTFAASTGTAPALAASIVNTSIGVKVATNAQTIATGTASAGTPVAATTTAWGFARTSATVLTLTAPSTTATGLPVSAGTSVAFEIQLGVAAGGTNIVTNGGSANTQTLAIATSPGDSQTVASPIVANDTVVVTATVAPTITFNLTAGGSGSGGTATNAVDFGTLSASAARYATAGSASGGTATSTPSALDLSVSTNAGSGYTLTYTAPSTLTDGTHPITAATITGSNTGTTGSAQFAMSGIQTVGSGATVPSAYLYNSTAGSSNWKFVTPTVTTLASNTGATADTVSVRFLSNIPSTQAPGNYAVTITYIATGNF